MPRILYIDDSRDARVLVHRFLEKAGHEVVTCASGDEGLIALAKGAIDVALLDLEMPGKDGIACLTAIRYSAHLAHTRVIMVTATPLRDVVQRVMKLGVQGIVIKSGNWAPLVVQRVDQVILAARRAAEAAPSATAPAPAAALHLVAAPGPLPPAGAARAAAPAPHAPAATPPAAPGFAIQPWTPPSLPAGDGPPTMERGMEILKTLKPMIARSELLETMLADTVSVRALRPAAQNVLHLLDRPGSSVQTIANAIRQDQALSVRLLKMANSSLYSRGDHVDNVAKAVARIGLDQIRSAVLSVAILDAFGSVPGSATMRPDWFWEHAAACGTLAMRLAQAAGRPKELCDTLFTAGLLHDLGRLLFTEHLPEHYPKVIDTAERLGLPLELVESRLLLLNHAEITDRLLRHWKFPASLIAPVAMHHLSVGSAKASMPRAADDAILLALANRLAHALLMGTSGNAVLYPVDEFLDHLQLSPARVAEVCASAADELADLRTNMLLRSGPPAESYADTVRTRLGDVRPLALAVHAGSDPVSMLVSTLQRGTPATHPNVITLRVTANTEKAHAMRLLADATETLTADNPCAARLPVLVLGNSKACLFNEGMLGDRPVRQLTLPISLERFLQEVKALAASAAETPAAPVTAQAA